MLNTAFSKKATKMVSKDYVLPTELTKIVREENMISDTTEEYRLQDVYTDEIWAKLNSLGLNVESFNNKRVLDLCSGAGFLTYHILKRANPKAITLVEISAREVRHSRGLLSKKYPKANLTYLNDDVLRLKYKDEFDIVIGNSFLHHLYNMPLAASKFKSYLCEGGVFISLHEPTLAALALESGNTKNLLKYYVRGKDELERVRYAGKGLVRKPFGGDVWFFEPNKLKQVFEKAGYRSVAVQGWHMFRSVVVARNSMHLNSNKKRLTKLEVKKLQRAIRNDKISRKLINKKYFGSVGIVAQK